MCTALSFLNIPGVAPAGQGADGAPEPSKEQTRGSTWGQRLSSEPGLRPGLPVVAVPIPAEHSRGRALPATSPACVSLALSPSPLSPPSPPPSPLSEMGAEGAGSVCGEGFRVQATPDPRRIQCHLHLNIRPCILPGCVTQKKRSLLWASGSFLCNGTSVAQGSIEGVGSLFFRSLQESLASRLPHCPGALENQLWWWPQHPTPMLQAQA